MSTPRGVLFHPRRSIAARVMLLVAVGALSTLALFGWASWSEFQRADAGIVREHQALAAAAARQFDAHLADVLSTLQQLANDARAVEPLAEHASELQDRVLVAWHAAESLDGVFVATLDGHVVARVPADGIVGQAHVAEAVSRVQTSPRPGVTSSMSSAGSGDGRVLLFVPLRNWQGALIGVVAGELDPGSRRFAQLAASLGVAPAGQLDLIDDRGRLIYSGDRRHQERSRVDIIATARLSLAPWQIASHRIDDTGASFERFGAILLWLGPVLVGGSLLLAWGAAWSVRRPLLALTGAAERLAEGDLTTPIPFTGLDEVGTLGRAFESMRIALEASRAEIEATNAALEARVERRTRELERLNQELRDRERMRQSLLRKVITAQEDERKRVARELHDEACQTVTALGLRLDAALAVVPPDSDAHAALARARELSARSLDELHRSMHALRPALLDDLGLVAAIRRYAERLTRIGIAVRFESTVSSLRLAPELETAVFRAVQEALTNIERHARAEMVLVQMSADAGVLAIEVEDDGVGFDPDGLAIAHDTGRGLGLLGIRERLELAGGVAEIHSSPGNGTHVEIRVPLPEGAIDVEDPGADRG